MSEPVGYHWILSHESQDRSKGGDSDGVFFPEPGRTRQQVYNIILQHVADKHYGRDVSRVRVLFFALERNDLDLGGAV